MIQTYKWFNCNVLISSFVEFFNLSFHTIDEILNTLYFQNNQTVGTMYEFRNVMLTAVFDIIYLRYRNMSRPIQSRLRD